MVEDGEDWNGLDVTILKSLAIFFKIHEWWRGSFNNRNCVHFRWVAKRLKTCVDLRANLKEYVIVRVFWKSWLNYSKSSFPIRFNLLHRQPFLFHFVSESHLWCFSSLANHYFYVSQHFNRNLGHRRNDSKYRDVAPLISTKVNACYHNPGGNSHMKQTGMLVVSLWGVNFGCLVSLKVSRAKGQLFQPQRSRLGLHTKK